MDLNNTLPLHVSSTEERNHSTQMTTKSYLSQLKNTKSRVSFETQGITQPEANPLICELLKSVSLRQTWGVDVLKRKGENRYEKGDMGPKEN